MSVMRGQRGRRGEIQGMRARARRVRDAQRMRAQTRTRIAAKLDRTLRESVYNVDRRTIDWMTAAARRVRCRTFGYDSFVSALNRVPDDIHFVEGPMKSKQTLGDAVTFGVPAFPTLSEQLAKRIADEILNERFAPGQRLKEVDLAVAFGVSRASIRESLRQLEGQGLVQIEARRGARVTQLSADEVDDLYEIRASLLAVASRRVALTRDATFLATAKVLLGRISQHASERTHARYFDAVYALSQLIAESAKSKRLTTLISSFSRQVARYTRLSLSTLERRKESAQGWRRLLAAIDAGDPVRAEQEMRRLVSGSQNSIREMLRANKQKIAA